MKAGPRIVIVGNGPVPDSAGPAIASADRVIRFNDCRSFRRGQRSDVVAVCNTGRPAGVMLGGTGRGSRGWGPHPAVRAAGALWCVRNPALFAALRAPLAITRPDLDDFCDDATEAFRAFATGTGKAFRVLRAETQRLVEAALAPFAPAPYVVPSSGIVVIADVLETDRDADVVVTGFSHSGWEGHPFAAEALLVDRWAAEGRLRRLDVRTPALAAGT